MAMMRLFAIFFAFRRLPNLKLMKRSDKLDSIRQQLIAGND